MDPLDSLASASSVSMASFASSVRSALGASFAQAVAEGRARPFVMPYSMLGAFFVPTLWLAVPHTRRPWLYRTRWLVVAFVVAFNVHVVRRTSSEKPSFAYFTGMTAAWGIISALNLLVWSRPQFDAARATRLPPGTPRRTGKQRRGQGPSDAEDSLRRRRGQRAVAAAAEEEEEEEEEEKKDDDDDDDKGKDDVFVWQTFPADAPFLERLGWVVDLTWSLRGSGWNWCIPSLPRPHIPPQVRPGDRVDLSAMPRVTSAGIRRCLTAGDFTRSRLTIIAAMYLLADVLHILGRQDPYFVLGPDRPSELPPHLAALPSWLLLAWRELLCATTAYCAIQGAFSLNDLVQHWLLRACNPARAATWFHPSVFGSFSQVLDRGLAGWWGAWWHQTFRHQFSAPVAFLLRHGYLVKGSSAASLAALFVPFVQSGLLHVFGSMSSLPPTKPWRPMVFFLLQPAGILFQDALAKAARPCLPSPPSRASARAANFLFTLTWMYVTGVFMTDDFASDALWLLEPVPFSPLRCLGFGHANDPWWRWHSDPNSPFVRWHSGKHWWESGIAF